MILCSKCGFKWEPRVADPVSCPRCKRRFDKVIVGKYPYRCSHCGYEWKGYKPDSKECPRCKRYTVKLLQ